MRCIKIATPKPKLPPGTSSEDRETIMDEAAHIPDRDQQFHRGPVDTPAETWEDDLNGWSSNLEDQVTGEDQEAGGVDKALDQFMCSRGPEVSIDAHPKGRGHSAEDLASARTDVPPLEPEDVANLRSRLEERRLDLEQVIVAKEQLVRAQLGVDSDANKIDFNHPADTMEGDLDYEREIALVSRERAELTRVNLALVRMAEGHYGECESCGGNIPWARLEAVPDARSCVACQDLTEATHRIAHTPGVLASNQRLQEALH